jgi:hypothetical protein
MARKRTTPSRSDLPAERAVKAMTVSEAYRMRCEGQDYVEIAKALKIRGGWVEAHRLVMEHYGELVANTDKQALREREAGRMMEIRAAIEADVRRGEKWAIEADLKLTEQIGKFMGLSEGTGGGGATAAVQVNITPPWGQEPRVDVEIEED